MRVLEYYDGSLPANTSRSIGSLFPWDLFGNDSDQHIGILFLTSNRVGSFDAAFKSRIQLALHYDDLSGSDRQKIWRTFFQRLRELNETNVDYDDLDDHLLELAKHGMNGRQIRNAITTARQLAQFDDEKLSYTQLKQVINVSAKFEEYLKQFPQDG